MSHILTANTHYFLNAINKFFFSSMAKTHGWLISSWKTCYNLHNLRLTIQHSQDSLIVKNSYLTLKASTYLTIFENTLKLFHISLNKPQSLEIAANHQSLRENLRSPRKSLWAIDFNAIFTWASSCTLRWQPFLVATGGVQCLALRFWDGRSA